MYNKATLKVYYSKAFYPLHVYIGGFNIRIWGWGGDLFDLQRISLFSRVAFDGLPPHGSDYGLHACILQEVPGTYIFSYIVPMP